MPDQAEGSWGLYAAEVERLRSERDQAVALLRDYEAYFGVDYPKSEWSIRVRSFLALSDEGNP